MVAAAAVVTACRALIDAFAATPLSYRVAPDGRHPVSIAEGYVPLLVDYTEEDREAKGLRKLEAGQAGRAPVHDTVLESADRERLLFLTGPSGCGKRTSLLHLALHLAGAVGDDPRWTLAGLARAVPRNEAGTVIVERWSGAAVAPLPIEIEGPTTLTQLLTRLGPLGQQVLDGTLEALLWIDRAEGLGDTGPAFLDELAALSRERPGLRTIVTADVEGCVDWRLPRAFARRRVLPLTEPQRAALRDAIRPGSAFVTTGADAEVTGHAGVFALALENGIVDRTSIAVIDRWVADVATRHRLEVDDLIASAVGDGAAPLALDVLDLARLRQPFVRRALVARALQGGSQDQAIARYRDDPSVGSPVIRLLARRITDAGRSTDPLIERLLRDEDAAPGAATIEALRIAEETAVDAPLRPALLRGLATIVAQGRLPLAMRIEAGRALALHGDPRDLDALIAIAPGPFTMGSTAHPNSAPPHRLTLDAYRIGRYPVTNDRYCRFVEATGRAWHSQDGRLARRGTSPAVDLTWHDARAYCAWLTTRWRAVGRIERGHVVRLPTEPEWERAARGLRADDGLVFPWPGAWQDDRANAEEAGINDTCPVGLFPAGRSPDGCDDMAGQVWEWTSTLWGDDMAFPRYAYPYADDGREDVAASGSVRRVLRGACFSSPCEKANCTYRGSLEPDGYWRGNGFRIVVA